MLPNMQMTYLFESYLVEYMCTSVPPLTGPLNGAAYEITGGL